MVGIALRGSAKGTAGIPIAASQQFKRQVDDDEDGKGIHPKHLHNEYL